VIALIDADIVSYRCAAACENETLSVACSRAKGMTVDILMGVDHDNRFYDAWKLYLTGSTNFRNAIAVTAPYKGNRADKQKPKHLAGVRRYFIDEWDAIVSDGEEADDAITIAATAAGDDFIIASLDKDFKQKSGWHYNFIKKQHQYVSKEEGTLLNPRQALDEAVRIANREILYKMAEFGYVVNGQSIKDYVVPTIDNIDDWLKEHAHD